MRWVSLALVVVRLPWMEVVSFRGLMLRKIYIATKKSSRVRMAMTTCLSWKVIWNSQNTATLWSKARQSSRSPRNVLEGTLYFAEKVELQFGDPIFGHWGWWDHLPNFCSIVFYSNKQMVSSSGWGLIWGFFFSRRWLARLSCGPWQSTMDPWFAGAKSCHGFGLWFEGRKKPIRNTWSDTSVRKSGWWFWLFVQQFVDTSYYFHYKFRCCNVLYINFELYQIVVQNIPCLLLPLNSRKGF